MIIGGRIIPSFTRNWLARENPGRLPAPFDRFDVAAIAVSAGGAVGLVWLPGKRSDRHCPRLAAVLQVAAPCPLGWRPNICKDPLVLILHLAYAFIPIGFVLVSLSILLSGTVPVAAGFHALGGGAIGAMTLSVMVRATLGHTGRKLEAGVSARSSSSPQSLRLR